LTLEHLSRPNIKESIGEDHMTLSQVLLSTCNYKCSRFMRNHTRQISHTKYRVMVSKPCIQAAPVSFEHNKTTTCIVIYFAFLQIRLLYGFVHKKITPLYI